MTVPRSEYTTAGSTSAGSTSVGSTSLGSTSVGSTSEPTPDVASTSVGELISQVTQDLSTLMRQELDLAKAELKQEATKTGKAAGELGAAGFSGYMAVLFLSLALTAALAAVMGWGWAALIVAVLWGIAAAVLYAIGRKQLREVRPKPEQTVDTLKEVPDALRGR